MSSAGTTISFSTVRIIAAIRVNSLVAASLFGFVHVIYKDPLMLAAMMIVGFFWYHLYLRTRNLIGVTISHITLGILTIALGLVN